MGCFYYVYLNCNLGQSTITFPFKYNKDYTKKIIIDLTGKITLTITMIMTDNNNQTALTDIQTTLTLTLNTTLKYIRSGNTKLFGKKKFTVLDHKNIFCFYN